MRQNRTLQASSAEPQQAHGSADVASQPSKVLFIADLCRELSLSRSTVEKLRRLGLFPIPELPGLDNRPRWSREAVEAFLREKADPLVAARRRRQARAKQVVAMHGHKSARRSA